MEKVMGNKQYDFLQPLLDLMNKRMDDLTQTVSDNTSALNAKIDENTDATKRVQRDVAELQKKTAPAPQKFTIPSNVIYLLALGFVILLVIIAGILHVDLKGLLP